MIRETSIKAYEEIKASGLLSDARFFVYDTVFHNGPITAGECFLKMQEANTGHTVVKGSVCARLTELRDLGCVAEVGKKICQLTGKTAMLWQVTKNLPVKLEDRTRQVKCACCDGRGFLFVERIEPKKIKDILK